MIFPPTYIKMMEKSPIQKEWKPKVGDWIWKDWSNTKWLNKNFWELLTWAPLQRIDELLRPDGVYPEMGIPKIWWLPTSDDWWEMIIVNWGWTETRPLPTLAILWLAIEKFANESEWKSTSILELLSAFWHSKRGLKLEEK